MDIISLENVSITFKQKRILPEFLLTLQEKKLYGLIGANGVGKTTLLKLIAGFIQPTKGEVKVFDLPPFDEIKVAQNLIFIDDKQTYPPYATVETVCTAFQYFYTQWDGEFASKLFNYFQFQSYDRFDLLSKGRKSLFNCIVGLCSNCAITLMDEPTTGMDIKIREDFYKFLLNSYIKNPRTIIISSHYMDEIEQLLEEVIIITSKKEVVLETVEELQSEFFVVSGTQEQLDVLTFKEIYSITSIGNQKQMVVRVSLTTDFLEQLEKMKIQYTKLSASQASTYLTHEMRGGIEDVLR